MRARNATLLLALAGCAPQGGDELTATVELLPVDESSEVFSKVAAALASDPAAREAGISVEAPLPSLSMDGPPELQHVFGPSDEALRAAVDRAGVVPEASHTFVTNCEDSREDADHRCQLLYVDDSAKIEVGRGSKARKQKTEYGGEVVVLMLSDNQATAWKDLTTKYVGHRVAMRLNGRVISSPTIAEPIPGGTLWLTPGGGDTAYVDRVMAELVAPQARKAERESP